MTGGKSSSLLDALCSACSLSPKVLNARYFFTHFFTHILCDVDGFNLWLSHDRPGYCSIPNQVKCRQINSIEPNRFLALIKQLISERLNKVVSSFVKWESCDN